MGVSDQGLVVRMVVDADAGEGWVFIWIRHGGIFLDIAPVLGSLSGGQPVTHVGDWRGKSCGECVG